MTAIQWISKEAKAIRKKQPLLSWSECIKIASALYKAKHKTTTIKKKVGAVKYVEKGEPKSAKAKKVYQVNRTKKGTYKSVTRIAGTSTHKDTKSHNVRINVMSGVNDATINEIKHINDILKKWKVVLMTLEQQKKLEKNTLKKTLFKNDIYRVKNVISDLKTNLNRLKKHIK